MVVAADPRWKVSRRKAGIGGMKLLVTGNSGQLARSLADRSATRPGIDLVTIGRPELDLEVPGSAANMINVASPEVVINTAAVTDVDGAEEQPLREQRINGEAAGEIAAAAASVGAAIIQNSTDYVFDGNASRPYAEEAPTRPL